MTIPSVAKPGGTRVVVTGIGVVSAFGNTFPDLWSGLAAGQSAIRPMSPPSTGTVRFGHAAEAIHFQTTDYFEEKEAALLDRFTQMGAVAAREAVLQSRLRFTPDLQEQTAIVMGSSGGGKATEDQGFYTLYAKADPRVSPFTIPRSMPNAAASRISYEHGITGPVYTVSTACSSANHAIGQAFHMVRSGQVEVALAGGSEAPFSLGFLKAWEAMRVVAPDTCRPFSRDRKGLILGEGAGVLLLEGLDHARARGATILGEIAGFGMTSDAHHITQPSALGAARAMRKALSDASISPEQVGYINAHGTGTTANDATESEAIHSVFGDHTRNLRVSSTKSMHGHALGAAGALEAAATLGALQYQLIPPTANFTEPDPACDLNVVPNFAVPAEIQWALSNSFAFGGLNAVLLLRRWID